MRLSTIETLIAGAVFLVVIAFMGLDVWFGWWRGWTKNGYPGQRMLALPWLALAIVLGVTLILLYVLLLLRFPLMIRTIEPDWVYVVASVAVLSLALFGFIVSWTRWPRWAVPGWYREQVMGEGWRRPDPVDAQPSAGDQHR